MSSDSPLQIKYVIIGASGAGKTAILKRFIDNKFAKNNPSTVGIEYFCQTTTIENHALKLMLWDTAGQERFYSIARAYFRSAIGIVLVYDIADRKTFDAIPRWLRDARSDANPQNVAILVGNKTDLQARRQVSTEEGEKFAKTNNLLFIESSALDATNISEVFYNSATEIVHKIDAGLINTDDLIAKATPIQPSEEEDVKEKKKGCC